MTVLLMDGSESSHGNRTLVDLARRLRLQKPCISSSSINPSKSNEYDSPPSSRITRAAVLICIFEGNDGDLRVILTKRSSTLSSHSGAVSLPGGKTEEGDVDDVATALREAKEEIGLEPELVDVVAVLESFIFKNGMMVVPVVGLIYDRKACHLTPNAAEVEVIFDAPLEMFLKNENRREVEFKRREETYLIDSFDYETEGRHYDIYGITLLILIEAASTVYQRPPAFLLKKQAFLTNISHI